jgi:hypothetical protein
LQFGLTIASGISGNHHPVHKSNILVFSSNSMKIFKIIESKKCFKIISSGSLIAERFILEFFSIKISKNFSNFSISLLSNSILYSQNIFIIFSFTPGVFISLRIFIF